MPGAKSMFGNLKSKLGLGGQPANQQYDDYDDYQEYDEYDDYEEYDDYDGYPDDRYEDERDRDRVSMRSTDSSGLPRLVTREDAVESTRSNSSFGRDSLTSSSYRSSGRTMVDSSLPASMTPEGSAAVSAATNNRAHGLDSLFGAPSRSREDRASSDLRSSVANTTGKRNLQIIKPSRYDDAEGVSRALKLGNVAILVLTETSDVLARRILDFSFGATSALSGSVEGIAPKTYALTTQTGLTDQEKAELTNLGIMS